MEKENNNSITLIPVSYCRKSSEDKGRQILSIDSQADWSKEVTRERGLKIINTFSEEKSAKTPYKRTVFNEMIAQIKKGVANCIVCWKLDRLARNPEEAGIIIGMLKRGEIQCIITEGRNYYPEDNAIISYVDFGMADQFVRDLSKGVKRGLDKKVSIGWRPGRAPLGYLNTRTNFKGEQEILSDPARFNLVKQVWQWMLTGNYTVPQIMEVANEQWKLTQPATRSRAERALHLSQFYKIFTKTFYYGWYKWNNEWVKGNHEPMITEEEYDRVQFLLGRKGRPRPKTHVYAFTGLMRCGNCGAAIIVDEKWKHQKNGNIHHYIYYRCSKKFNKKRGAKCLEKYVELDDFENQIDQILSSIEIPQKFRDWALKYLHEINTNEAKSHESIIEAKHRRYETIVKQVDNLLLEYTSPDNAGKQLITNEEYSKLRTDLLKEKKQLETELGNTGNKIEEWIKMSEKVFDFVAYSRIHFAKGDLNVKRAIFSCLGSNLTLKDRKIQITLKKPFQFIAEGLSKAQDELSRLEPIQITQNRAEFEKSVAEFPLMSG
jgi:DNA invertase Pin-like site-specific DNA recombinase